MSDLKVGDYARFDLSLDPESRELISWVEGIDDAFLREHYVYFRDLDRVLVEVLGPSSGLIGTAVDTNVEFLEGPCKGHTVEWTSDGLTLIHPLERLAMEAE